jgi:hypothetical protein
MRTHVVSATSRNAEMKRWTGVVADQASAASTAMASRPGVLRRTAGLEYSNLVQRQDASMDERGCGQLAAGAVHDPVEALLAGAERDGAHRPPQLHGAIAAQEASLSCLSRHAARPEGAAATRGDSRGCGSQSGTRWRARQASGALA